MIMKTTNTQAMPLIYAHLACLFLFSCVTSKKVVKETTQDKQVVEVKVVERVIDTIVKSDTSYVTIQGDCDTNGKVVYQIIDKGGKRSKIEYKVLDNRVSISAICNELALKIKEKDSTITNLNEQIKTKEKDVKREPIISRFWLYLIGLVGLVIGLLIGKMIYR
jgi:hypothetical protein